MSTPVFETTPERILRRLDWHVVRRLDGLLQGDYRSVFHGHGLDFSDLREYQIEDDVRFIDWNVSARMDRPYVRKYYEDRAITGWFLLDLSPSMDFGSFSILKRSMLVDFVGVMARLLTRNGNRVGAVIHDGRTGRVIPAGSGRNQVLLLIHELLRAPEGGRVPLTDLGSLFEQARRSIRRRALLFVMSDFISIEGWQRRLRLMNQRHEVIGVRLVDRAEMDLPDVGAVMLRDAETGEQMFVDTHDRRFRQRFQQLARGREEQLATTFRTAGVDFLTVATDDDLVQTLISFAAMRKQKRR